MKKIQNYFSYLRSSELSTEQLFELFYKHNNGEAVVPYTFNDSLDDISLTSDQFNAYKRLLQLGNSVTFLSKDGIVLALIGYSVL